MIEVGEYCRSKYGEIGIVTKIYPQLMWRKKKNPSLLDFNEIKSHSKNLTDLIEVGDYVNRNLIIEEYIDIKDDEENFIGMCVKKGIQVDRDEYEEGGCIDIGDYFYFKPLENINIKTILTHEQYEQNCYKL